MIGILDSGIGGLSIYREIKKLLPDVGVIYFADSNNFPYGEKSEIELNKIVEERTQKLISMDVKIIVLACNSATVGTIERLREKYDLPFVGIEPAIKPAVSTSKTRKVGVMATKRTVSSHDTDSFSEDCEVIKIHNAGLIDSIENNLDQISDEELKKAILPYLEKGADSVVLGCTHYHFVKERLERIFPDVKFFAPDEAVARRVQDLVVQNKFNFLKESDIFLVSGDEARFKKSLKTLLGIENADIRKV